MPPTQTKSIPDLARPVAVPAASYASRPRPFLARHPGVGYAISAVSLLVFALITALVLANSSSLAWDLPAAQSVHDWASKQPAPLVLLMRFFSAYGRDGVALIALILTVAWARKGARRELWLLYFGLLGTELWFQVLSNLVNRARPEFKDPFETLIGAGYPSGHAATNVVLGGMILYLLLPRIRTQSRRALLVGGVLLVVGLVIFSRLFLGLHYPTDLLGGAFLGLGWGALIFTITDRHFWPPQKETRS